jgi:methylthioribose-1-phosphate isomerase
LRLSSSEEIFEAIRSLRVRGAPAIGVAAAIGMAVIANNIKTSSFQEFSAVV